MTISEYHRRTYLCEALNQLPESAAPNTYIECVESAETAAYAEEE